MAPTTAQKKIDCPESHRGVRETLLHQVTATETLNSKPQHCKIKWNWISSATEICQGPLASALLPSQGLNPADLISKINFRQIWIYDFYYRHSKTDAPSLQIPSFLFNSLLPWAQIKSLLCYSKNLGKLGRMRNSKSRKHFRSIKHMEKPMDRGHWSLQVSSWAPPQLWSPAWPCLIAHIP